MSDTDGVSIKGLFQSLIPEDTGLFQAKVLGTDELKVVSCNNEKLIISDSLICPEHVKPLSVGDIVYILFIERQGVFFILGRS